MKPDNMNFELKVHVITGFSHGVCEIYALLGSYESSQEDEDRKLQLLE